jgi:hypothetical protein
MALLALLVSTAAFLSTPHAAKDSVRPPRLAAASITRSALLVQMVERDNAELWPEPAKSPAQFKEEQAAEKEAAEAEAMANPKPFLSEGGGFSPVAAATVAVFLAAGSFFFQGISGGGVSRFASDQPPEVQACLKKATTRSDASACLPAVPIT